MEHTSMNRKRSSNDQYKTVGQYLTSPFRTDYLPDPWLAQYENEPPGYIRAVRGDLTNCYIKEQKYKPIYSITFDIYGRKIKTITGQTFIYVWTKVEH